MLKKIGIGMLLLVLVVCGLALTKPDTFTMQRETTINAPRAKVFAMVNDFHRWGEWSPWEKLDPEMKRTFGGPPAGNGSTYEWAGNSKAGAGRMEITNSTEPSKIDVKLDFSAPIKANNITEFTFDSTAAGTHVTWNMHGPNNFLSKVMTVFISTDKMVGPDFERGLSNMKAAAEKP